MIDLKRNTKGDFVKATGLNSQAWRIYKPNQKEDFKISRSRFEDFMKCSRCFYLRLVSPKLRKAGKEVQTTMGDMTSASEEAISGQRIVKIFESTMFEFKKFSKIVTRNRKMQTKLAQLSGVNSFVIEPISKNDASFSIGIIAPLFRLIP